MWSCGRWMWTGVVGLVLGLSGCGGSSSTTGTTSVRLVNATLTHPTLAFVVNGSTVASAVALDSLSAYTSPASGDVTLQVDDSGTGTNLGTQVQSLGKGAQYTMVACETDGAVATSLVVDDFDVPSVNTMQLRFLDLAADAGKLDVYRRSPD